MTKAQEIIEYMESLYNENELQGMLRFFKTGPGDYGEGDEFLGIKSPQVREIVKAAIKREQSGARSDSAERKQTRPKVKHVDRGFPLDEVPELLMSRWHEVRLCGFLILVDKFERLSTKRLEQDEQAIQKRDEIVTLYLQYAEQANNWDLVDLSVYKILGHWLMLPSSLGDKDYKRQVLDELATSPCLWKQRMSIVCSWYPSHHDDPSWCLRYAEIHLHHPHDLMHKAVGWMLREMGKSYVELLRDFLRQHAHEMPRTMLRYAIEKLPETERKEWLAVPYDRFSTDYVTRTNPFAGIAIPDFVDIILGDKDKCDGAMYYLLKQRLNRQLRERYDAYRHQLFDTFDDILEDFFLYLREGKTGTSRQPYQPLQRIKKKESFETWILNTFRNYLNARAKAEDRISLTSYNDHGFNGLDGFNAHNHELYELNEFGCASIADEQKLAIASQLIAYAHQVFYPRGRFIFLRSLLTMLNRQKALPTEEVAIALGMTHISYRVILHRMKRNLVHFRNRLLQGEHLRLDDQHQLMASHLNDDFTHLYPTLLTYYTETISTLKCADAIRQLRQRHYEETGIMAHEPSPDKGPIRTTVTAFWNKFNRLLIY